jgi:prepilin-type N-terminal cleavage/methylation domain-containing protein
VKILIQNNTKSPNSQGFTIVELLIVIVVIAILAAITIVAYSNISNRAQDTQTISAADQWITALKLYETDNGSLPTIASCLGQGYFYNVDGAGLSGIGECRQDNASYGIIDDPSFDALLAKYISSQPTPYMLTAVTSSTSWVRGAYYYVDKSGTPWKGRVDFIVSKSAQCPSQIAGIVLLNQSSKPDGKSSCAYVINTIPQ